MQSTEKTGSMNIVAYVGIILKDIDFFNMFFNEAANCLDYTASVIHE